MNIPVISQLIGLLEEIFKTHAPEVVAAATSPEVQAIEKEAVTAAVQGAVSSDPKIQAGIEAYQALQNLKAAINTPPPAPTVAPPVEPPAA